MVLGIVPDEIFADSVTDQRIAFSRNDILVLYTDGVTEVQNADGTEFGNQRLATVVQSLAKREAKGITRGILERIQLFSGTDRQSDDFTLVVAKRK